VITWNDDIADLEQLSRQTQLSGGGGGKMVSEGVPPHTWTYVVEHQPTTPVCGVQLSGDGIHGHAYVVSLTDWIAMQPNPEAGGSSPKSAVKASRPGLLRRRVW